MMNLFNKGLNKILILLLLCFSVSCTTLNEDVQSGVYEISHTIITFFEKIYNKCVGFVDIDKNDNLYIYYPQYSHIDLVCGSMPSMDEDSVIMVVPAAFTTEKQVTFNHNNIAGNHVSGGVFYSGKPCDWNTGAFVYYNNQFTFLYAYYGHEFLIASKNEGAAFAQETLIYNFLPYQSNRIKKGKNFYRTLCELNGKLCIVESKVELEFLEFRECLMQLKVRHALNLDMQPIFNYAWYRTPSDIVELQSNTHNSKYCTNWLVFYK